MNISKPYTLCTTLLGEVRHNNPKHIKMITPNRTTQQSFNKDLSHTHILQTNNCLVKQDVTESFYFFLNRFVGTTDMLAFQFSGKVGEGGHIFSKSKWV